MLRRLVALVVALVPLCLAQGGGGVPPHRDPLPGGERARGHAQPEPARAEKAEPVAPPSFESAYDLEAPPPEPARELLMASDFPRFLMPLNGETAGQAGRGRAFTERLVLLTFDDGPDLQGTAAIMRELDRRGLKAVFFVQAAHIVRNRPEDLARRELLRKLALGGHHVGNHTMNHLDLCRLPDAIAREVDSAAEVITYSTGVRPFLFRAPYGARCRALDRALAERDVLQVGWNVDPQEWRGDDENAIFAHVTGRLAHATGPIILLLHDKNLAAVRALPRILDWIDQEEARVARAGGRPIRVVDYSVLLANPPPAPLAQK